MPTILQSLLRHWTLRLACWTKAEYKRQYRALLNAAPTRCPSSTRMMQPVMCAGLPLLHSKQQKSLMHWVALTVNNYLSQITVRLQMQSNKR